MAEKERDMLTYGDRVLASCKRMAARMGCEFVQNERWAELVRASSPQEDG